MGVKWEVVVGGGNWIYVVGYMLLLVLCRLCGVGAIFLHQLQVTGISFPIWQRCTFAYACPFILHFIGKWCSWVASSCTGFIQSDVANCSFSCLIMASPLPHPLAELLALLATLTYKLENRNGKLLKVCATWSQGLTEHGIWLRECNCSCVSEKSTALPEISSWWSSLCVLSLRATDIAPCVKARPVHWATSIIKIRGLNLRGNAL